jgi:hypothetical protein
MKTSLATCFVLAAVLPSLGCIKRLKIELYNDSGRPLTVEPSEQDVCRLQVAEVCRFWYVPQISISGATFHWEFQIAPLTGDLEAQREVVEARGPLERVLRLRLTDSGAIYVVAPGRDWSSDLPAQPTGYPLRPTRLQARPST